MTNKINKQQPLAWLNITAALEYYDFAIYALLAPIIGSIFFSNFKHPTFYALATFIISYLARPIGGFIFAKIGDRYGRKPSLLASGSILALATILLALTPTTNGTLAIVWLITCRLVQGLCWGAEVPGVATIISESYTQKIYFRMALLIMSIGLGALVGGAVITALHHFVTQAAILNAYWRIPFAGGAILALACAVLRRKLYETRHFRQAQHLQPARLFNFKEIIEAISWQLPISILIFMIIMLPGAFPKTNLSLLITMALAWSCLSLPLAGWLHDAGYKKSLHLFALIFSFGASLSWYVFSRTGLELYLIVAMLSIETVISLLSPVALLQITRLFATKTRLVGSSIAYNISYLIASLTPLLILKTSNKNIASSSLLLIIALFIVLRFNILTNNHRPNTTRNNYVNNS